jgi:phosphatidylglycerol:prolipoprotein diacylglycerol transferase
MDFQSTHILIGNLQIRYYGIIIVTALLVGAYVASLLAKRTGRDADHVWGGLTWAIIPGIIGARLWFVLFPPIGLTAGCGIEGEVCQNTAWFIENFFNLENGAIAIWSGGLSIFGAIIGGGLGAWLYLGKWHNTVVKVFNAILIPFIWLSQFVSWLVQMIIGRVTGEEVEPFAYEHPPTEFPDAGIRMAPWLDIAAVAIPIAQAIGRIANYINQELYGIPTSLPWGIEIPSSMRVAPYKSGVDFPADTLFHPIWAYEAIWSLVAFYVLWRIYNQYRDRLLTGDMFLMYIAQYSFIRFLLEFLRVEVAVIGNSGINSSQAITVVAFVVSVALLIYRHRPGNFEAAKAADEQA